MARLKTKSTLPPPSLETHQENIIYYTTAMLSFVGFFHLYRVA